MIGLINEAAAASPGILFYFLPFAMLVFYILLIAGVIFAVVYALRCLKSMSTSLQNIDRTLSSQNTPKYEPPHDVAQ